MPSKTSEPVRVIQGPEPNDELGGWRVYVAIRNHPEWKAAADLVWEGGAWVVSALTFLPMTAGLALDAVTYSRPPKRGLTQVIMRELTVSEIGPATANLRARDASTGDITPLVDLLGEPGDAREMRKKARGRPGRTDLEYATWAKRYVEACQLGRSPNAALAEEYHMAPTTVRDIVQQLRLRSFLTAAPGRGKHGGELTAKTRRILSQEEATS